jgi:WD40 repeat protein
MMYFLIPVSEVQKVHQVQWDERPSELSSFQSKWRAVSKRRYVTFLNIPSFLGNILAAGDDETVRIWELSTKSCLQVLEDHGKRWGQITCLSWLSGHNDTSLLNAIAFGTSRGLIVIYRRLRMEVSSNLS